MVNSVYIYSRVSLSSLLCSRKLGWSHPVFGLVGLAELELRDVRRASHQPFLVEQDVVLQEELSNQVDARGKKRSHLKFVKGAVHGEPGGSVGHGSVGPAIQQRPPAVQLPSSALHPLPLGRGSGPFRCRPLYTMSVCPH